MPVEAPLFPLLVFFLAYLLFALLPTRRSVVAMAGAGLLILSGSLVAPGLETLSLAVRWSAGT